MNKYKLKDTIMFLLFITYFMLSIVCLAENIGNGLTIEVLTISIGFITISWFSIEIAFLKRRKVNKK